MEGPSIYTLVEHEKQLYILDYTQQFNSEQTLVGYTYRWYPLVSDEPMLLQAQSSLYSILVPATASSFSQESITVFLVDGPETPPHYYLRQEVDTNATISSEYCLDQRDHTHLRSVPLWMQEHIVRVPRSASGAD